MAAAAAGEPCLGETGRLAAQPVEWLSLDGSRLLYGAGTELSVAEAGPVPVRRATAGLPVAAGSAMLVGDRVFWSDAVGILGRLQLDSDESTRSVSPWRGQPVGRVRLGRMDDYVLAAEDGFGIHVLRIPVHHGPYAEHGPSADLQRVGGLSLPAEFTAVASSVRPSIWGWPTVASWWSTRRTGTRRSCDKSTRRLLHPRGDVAGDCCCRARALIAGADLARAMVACRQALEENPDSHEALYVLGSVHYAGDAYVEAIAAFDRAIGTGGPLPLYLRQRADAYANLKRYEEAVRDYEAALDADRSDAQAHYGLGIVSYNRG